MSTFDLLPIDQDTAVDEAEKTTDEWVAQTIPNQWQEAARTGGRAALHKIRTPADYDAWYPQFARSGLVAPTWPRPANPTPTRAWPGKMFPDDPLDGRSIHALFPDDRSGPCSMR